jgi:hypothetical protein
MINITIFVGAMQAQAATNTDMRKKISAKIIELESDGKDCNVRMSFHNGTDKKVNTYQMRDIKVMTKVGVVKIEHSNSFRLKINKTYSRGGIMVYGTSCEEISEIHINKIICTYQVPNSQFDSRYCKDDVTYQGTDAVRLIQAD